MNIAEKIEHAARFIPKTWPLQSFIATNPMWDATSSPMYDALREAITSHNINGCLSTQTYLQYYIDGLMNSSDINYAIRNWFRSIHVSDEIDDSKEKQIADDICDFFINKNYRSQLHEIEESNKQQINYNEEHTMAELINTQITKWFNSFFDLGQSTYQLPENCSNLLATWRELITLESSNWSSILKDCPDEPTEIITFCQQKLAIDDKELKAYFDQVIFDCIGWASFIKWLESDPDNHYTNKTATLNELVAIYMLYQCYFQSQSTQTIRRDRLTNTNEAIDVSIKHLFKSYINNEVSEESYAANLNTFSDLIHRMDAFSVKWIWQTAMEHHYQTTLNQLLTANQISAPDKNQPSAQAIFCIDTRSEGIRRHLEYHGNYETFGFAGFFGYPFKLISKTGEVIATQFPPLISIQDKVYLSCYENDSTLSEQIHSYLTTVNQTKRDGIAAFAFFEVIGLWLGLKIIAKTLFHHTKDTSHSTKSAINLDAIGDALDADKATAAAENFLLSIGLTENFAEIVLVCAHGATTDNNPFQASFDCGACGGHAGLPNAIVASAALNNSTIRQRLAEKGITIPADTIFVPSLHNTTTDEVSFYLDDTVRKNKANILNQLQDDLNTASENLRNERTASLPGDKNVYRRANSWSELLPEMGLANNAAFIAAPRHISRGLNLQRRVFLHSYDPSLDEDGTLLEGILTAPVIVAHWINMQYFFSTTDPDTYGAGNKAIHNVTGKLGVMEGNESDLKIGLPIQSVKFQDELLHQPLRLYVVLYAKRELADRIIANNPILRRLFNGQWLYLNIIEPGNPNVPR